MTNEQPEQWAVELALQVIPVWWNDDATSDYESPAAALLIQRAIAEREAELVGAIKWAGEVAPPVDHNGCVTVDMTLEQLNAMRTLAGFRALKSREAGHG